MGRPCTHESLGGKQGKPGGLVVQTPGAKCGDCGQVKRAPRAHRGRARRAPSTHQRRVRRAPWAEMDPTNCEYLTSQAIRGIWIIGHGCSPDKRYRRIRTCLPGEVESSSSPIRRDRIPDVRYPGGISENFRLGGMSNAMARWSWTWRVGTTGPGHGHLDMVWAHASVWGRHTDAAWSASGACCLVPRALIRDALVGTRSQEAPWGEGGSLLGEGSPAT